MGAIVILTFSQEYFEVQRTEAYKVDLKVVMKSTNVIYFDHYPKVRPLSELSQRIVKPSETT